MKAKATLGQSLRFAGWGLISFLRDERNGRIEATMAMAALGLCAFYHVSTLEWCLVLLCCAGVLSAEAMNAALEELADTLHPKRDSGIGRAKDLAAAAVLIMVVFSIVIGILIFGPRLLT